MDRPLQILLLEDSALDAELTEVSLRDGGIQCDLTRVQTRDDYTAALLGSCFDVILADYSLPQFDGISALEIAREQCPDVPFIFVSGALGEELAIETLKRGATDYVLKQRLARLAPSVLRALREAEERAERRRAEAALRESEREFRAIFDNASDAFVIIDDSMHYVDVNPAACTLFGISRDELLSHTIMDFAAADARDAALEVWDHFRAVGRHEGEFRIVRPDGAVREVDYTATADFLPGCHLAVLRDVTERKRAEAASRFLAEASTVLATSLDYATTMERLAQLPVPELADYSVIDVFEDDGRLVRAGAAHADPAREPLMRQLQQYEVAAGPGRISVRAALDEGRTILVPEVRDEQLAAAARDAEHLRILRVLNPRSLIVVRLVARGRALGVMTFAVAGSGRRYSDADLSAVEEFARRAAIAIDNARLHRELRRANEAKDEFLAMLAHELRNPLAPIRNSLEVARLRGSDPAALARVQEVVERQVHHLIRFTDDLLDVSRINRRKTSLQLEPLSLTDLVRETADDHRTGLEAAGLTFIVDLPGEPVWVRGDATRLAQVIGNLLGNASKFTDRGGRVTLQMTVGTRDGTASAGGGAWNGTTSPGNGTVLVTVRDTGIGIDPRMLPLVFEPFAQADRTLARSQGGLGLGLALVKGLVELHEGSVCARSEGPGHGAEIGFRLPILQRVEEEEMPQAPAVSATARRARPASQRRVLVIDDNQDAAETLRDLLEIGGHAVAVAYNGREGLGLAREFRPEVVLCDLGLPELDGFAVATELRTYPEMAAIRLIALSGYGRDEDRRRSREAGFDLHLTKPVDPIYLEQLITGAA